MNDVDDNSLATSLSTSEILVRGGWLLFQSRREVGPSLEIAPSLGRPAARRRRSRVPVPRRGSRGPDRPRAA